MARGFKVNLPYLGGYPGDGYYYVLCDVCGKKLRAKDAILVKDRHSPQYNAVLCHQDYDIVNPQMYPQKAPRKPLPPPKMIRPQGPDIYAFISTADEIESGDLGDPTGRTSTAAQHLDIIGATSTTITLQWMGPDDPGSGAITGWLIERESPVGGGFSTVTTTTIPAMYYEDTGLTAATEYNYRVSAVNRVGTGTASASKSITTNSS